MLVFLTVQSLSLFHHDKYGSDSQTEHQQYQAYHKSEDDVAEDETHDGAANGSCRPVDVPSLKAEKLQRTLQSLEERKVGIAVGITCLYHSCLRLYLLNTQRMNNHIFSHLRLTADAEEQRQSLCCSNEENTCSDDHHDLLFQNLLSEYNLLMIITPRKPIRPKETNWKQKFQKPKNENICLTYLDTVMKGNFHFLSSRQRLINRMKSL